MQFTNTVCTIYYVLVSYRVHCALKHPVERKAQFLKFVLDAARCLRCIGRFPTDHCHSINNLIEETFTLHAVLLSIASNNTCRICLYSCIATLTQHVIRKGIRPSHVTRYRSALARHREQLLVPDFTRCLVSANKACWPAISKSDTCCCSLLIAGNFCLLYY